MQIIQVEQRTPEWIAARLCKISGTRLCAAIGTAAKQDALINELIAELLTNEPKEVYVNKAMASGIEAEDYAVTEYEQTTGELTEQIGLCVSDKYDWLINSPDRLIKRGDKYSKAVEFKCPNADTLVGYIRANEIPKEYLPQVMSYFLVNDDLEELDLVGYSPRIQTDQFRMWIKNVKREELPLEETEKILLKFYNKWQGELRRLNLTI